MLNINKIEADINSRNLQSTDVSKLLGLKYTTTIGRREKGNWNPNDIEKFADYFGRTIAYYFDRDEKQNIAYKDNDTVRQLNDPEPCSNCAALLEKIKMLEKINKLQEDNINLLLEDKVKKEVEVKNRAQAG